MPPHSKMNGKKLTSVGLPTLQKFLSEIRQKMDSRAFHLIMSSQTHAGVKLSDGLQISIRDDGAAILDTRKGCVFSANAVGARVLALMREDRSIEEMTERISTEFGAEAERVRADIQRFVESLRANQMVQR